MYNKIVIGIDESYTRTGISIAADGKLIKVTDIPFRGLKLNSDKRKYLRNIITQIIIKNAPKAKELIIICERIRTFSGGFLSTNYIKATGALICTIVDVANEYNIPVYSVDTRSWKSKVVGTSKNKDKNTKKQETLDFVKKLGFNVSDDAADSACIALYGFISKDEQKLKCENKS